MRTVSKTINLGIPVEKVSKYITAIDQDGIKVHAENNSNLNYIKINAEGMEIHQNVSSTDKIVATFTATGAQIGQDDKTHVNVYSNSLELTDSAGATFFKVRDAVNESGEVTNTFVGDGSKTQFTLSYTASNTTYTVTQNGTTVSPTKTTTTITFSTAPAVGDIIVVVYNVVGNSAKAYDLGIRKTNTISGSYSVIEGYETIASGNYSHAEGYLTTAGGSSSHAEGRFTIASGQYSHAEGIYSVANNESSHAEGHDTTASGSSSHAEGLFTKASGSASHAEGYHTIASRGDCHAEGYYTTASGSSSHAEGNFTTASGESSHAGGHYTIAQRKSQTVIGKYNIADTTGADGTVRGDYALIIGNGTSDTARSNALTVDWKGNTEQQGRASMKDMTTGSSGEVEDFVNSLNVSGGGLGDFVIEQGTSGDWTYRKWNSGVAEAWGTYSSASKAGSSWISNLWYSDDNISFPSGVFNSAPLIQLTSRSSQWTAYSYYSATSTGFTGRFTKPNSNASAIYVAIYAKGTWK